MITRRGASGHAQLQVSPRDGDEIGARWRPVNRRIAGRPEALSRFVGVLSPELETLWGCLYHWYTYIHTFLFFLHRSETVDARVETRRDVPRGSARYVHVGLNVPCVSKDAAAVQSDDRGGAFAKLSGRSSSYVSQCARWVERRHVRTKWLRATMWTWSKWSRQASLARRKPRRIISDRNSMRTRTVSRPPSTVEVVRRFSAEVSQPNLQKQRDCQTLVTDGHRFSRCAEGFAPRDVDGER